MSEIFCSFEETACLKVYVMLNYRKVTGYCFRNSTEYRNSTQYSRRSTIQGDIPALAEVLNIFMKGLEYSACGPRLEPGTTRTKIIMLRA
jgi:hypothetical protein